MSRTLDAASEIADYEDMEDTTATHLIIIALLVLVILNLFLLDLRVFRSPAVRLADIQTSAVSPTPPLRQTGCDADCQSAIRQEIASQIAAVTPQQPRYIAAAQATSQHEWYIPLGTGSTTDSNWRDLPATETQIDPSLYGSGISTSFIVSLRNPTQNGQTEVQLYNVTDSHPVWGSHLTMNGPQTQTFTSGPITLDSGAKTYRIQLKSSLSYEVFVDNAKVRIIGTSR